MRAIARLFTPPCHLDPIHGGGNYLCKEAREGRRRSNEPSTIGTRLGPGNDLCPFSTPISAGCLGEKKEGDRGGCVWGPRHLISFRVNAGNPGLLEGCSPSFKKDFVRKWIIPRASVVLGFSLFLSLFFGFIKRFILSTRESKSLIFFHSWEMRIFVVECWCSLVILSKDSIKFEMLVCRDDTWIIEFFLFSFFGEGRGGEIFIKGKWRDLY